MIRHTTSRLVDGERFMLDVTIARVGDVVRVTATASLGDHHLRVTADRPDTPGRAT